MKWRYPLPRCLATALILASTLLVGSGFPLFAQELEPGPIGPGARVAVPGAGYALTAPDDWVTLLPSAEDASAIIDALRETDPDLAATAASAMESGVQFTLLMFAPLDVESGFRQNCNVIDYVADGSSLGLMLAADAADLTNMGDQLASGPDAAILELPAGEVGRLDYGLQYPTFQTAHAAYYFSDGSAHPPPDLHGSPTPRGRLAVGRCDLRVPGPRGRVGGRFRRCLGVIGVTNR